MAKTRPLTPQHRAEHHALSRHLAHTDTARHAVVAANVNDVTLHNRRTRHLTFATQRDATLAAADARLKRVGGAQPAVGTQSGADEAPHGCGRDDASRITSGDDVKQRNGLSGFLARGIRFA